MSYGNYGGENQFEAEVHTKDTSKIQGTMKNSSD